MAPRDASTGYGGPEDYPFDPTARADQLCGLERLRGIADRKLAADLFTLYLQADRNSCAQAASPSQRHASSMQLVHSVGDGAATQSPA